MKKPKINRPNFGPEDEIPTQPISRFELKAIDDASEEAFQRHENIGELEIPLEADLGAVALKEEYEGRQPSRHLTVVK